MTVPRRYTCVITLALLTGAVTFGCALNAQQPATARPLLFDGVTVVDVEHGKLIPAQRVVIVGNHIRAVGQRRAVPVPKGARVVNARGKYLIPGLWDMHVHPQHYTDFYYPLFIANGVTGIRDAWSDVRLDTLRMWRQEILTGTRVGPPRQLLSGAAIDEVEQCDSTGRERNPGYCSGPDIQVDAFSAVLGISATEQCTEFRRNLIGHICVRPGDTTDARHLVDTLKAAGADMIKTYELSKAMYFAIAAEARRIGIPFGGHALDLTPIEASDSGARILDHLNSIRGALRCFGKDATIEKCQPIAERFQRNGTWFVPTLTALIKLRQIGDMTSKAQSISDRLLHFSREFWRSDTLLRRNVAPPSQPDSLGFMHVASRVGLPLLLGTDFLYNWIPLMPPGFILHTELEMYVAEGSAPLEALRAVTLNPARMLHGTDSLGTVAPGKLADLVLLDADPLTDITNTSAIRAVVANGRYYDRAALDGLLAEVRARAKQDKELFERIN